MVKSDRNGLFRIEKENGNTIFINAIEKEDCLFDRIKNTGKFGFAYYEDNARRHHPDINNPIVYTMRKQVNPTFVISGNEINWIAKLSDPKAQYGVDFINRVGSSQMVSGGLDDWFFDIVMSISQRDDTWKVTVEAKGAEGGVLGSDFLLNEAPIDGYQKELSFIAVHRKPPAQKYLYIRSRKLSIYSLLSIELVAVNKERIRIKSASLTNPYGDRNLEEKEGIPGDVSQRLINDAIIALRGNVYPNKKIDDYLKEYNETKTIKP